MKRNINEFLLFFLMIFQFLLFLSHSLLNSSTTTTTTTTTFSYCLPHQSSILLQLKSEFALKRDEFFDGYPKMENWKAGSDCCSWDGVSCNMATGHVLSLDLSNSWLDGPLRSNSSLFSLIHLQKLNLAWNNFTSCPIPLEFGQLTRLTHLNLSSSMFSGNIPIFEISRLTNLISLDLSNNVLYLRQGDDQLGRLTQNMTKLRQLHLDRTNLSSPIPEYFGNLSSLTHLSFEACTLHGEFPTNVFHLPKIQFINLSQNKYLSGSLPEFRSGSLLEVLDLSKTSFSSKLPNSIGNLKSLNFLELGNCNFSGIVPSSLSNLTELAYLGLSFNHFSGQIPSSLGNLIQLESLILSSNFFEGKLPISLPHRIQYIDLDNNHLIGPIPSSTIPNLTFLQSLDLSHNSFTGVIPSSLLMMPSLLILKLEHNQFTGSLNIQNISDSVSNLMHLSLSGNKLSGCIPSSISKLTMLTYLYLDSNDLSGSLDVAIFSKLSFLWCLDISNNWRLSLTNTSANSVLPKFAVLSFSSCNISEFPIFLKMQVELKALDLSNNSIRGQIPNWLLSIGTSTLRNLNLSHNSITGWEEAPLILPWRAMYSLDLHSNMLHGSLVVPPMSTGYFSISENNLVGSIDPLFCKLGELRYLDLSSNNLSGIIPQCLGDFNSFLFVLNLRRNNFRGDMPRTCGNRSRLHTLDLSYNNLHGKIPKSLIKCKALQILNLSQNKMSDTFPFWIENLSQLQVLMLSHNKFYGPIWYPHKFSGFVSLSIIDLSFNDFTGSLPSHYFQNWTSMKEISYNKSQLKSIGDIDRYHYSMSMMNKGREIFYLKIFTIFVCIDFSNNRFNGEIPRTIGDLRSLMVLNLSSNNFTGLIPVSLGNLIELESLDLSKNKFIGEIPEQLTNLTFLGYLNLSENELVGPIPQAGQIGIFSNSSFEGNWGLCGLPLSKNCETLLPPSEYSEELDSILSGLTWKVVVIGYGCGLIIGLIIGHIITSRRPNLIFEIFGVIPHLKYM